MRAAMHSMRKQCMMGSEGAGYGQCARYNGEPVHDVHLRLARGYAQHEKAVYDGEYL